MGPKKPLFCQAIRPSIKLQESGEVPNKVHVHLRYGKNANPFLQEILILSRPEKVCLALAYCLFKEGTVWSILPTTIMKMM